MKAPPLRAAVGAALLLAASAAQAHGGSDWLLAVSATYSAVLLGAGAGVLAAWRPGLTLPRWVLGFALAIGVLAWAWPGGVDPALAALVLGLTSAVTAGAFGVLRWLARRWRRGRAPDDRGA